MRQRSHLSKPTRRLLRLARYRPRATVHPAISLAIVALLALLLANCWGRRAFERATPTVPPAATQAGEEAGPPPVATAGPPTGPTPAADTAPGSGPVVAQKPPAARRAGSHLGAVEAAFASAPFLEQAAWHHDVGNYEEEERLLNRLLGDPRASFAQRQTSLYRLAVAALVREEPALALDRLEEFQRTAGALPEDSPLRVNSLLLRAEALAGLGFGAQAVDAYNASLARRREAVGVVGERIANAWVAVGDWPQAANALRRAANGAPDSSGKVRLLERLAGALQAWRAVGRSRRGLR